MIHNRQIYIVAIKLLFSFFGFFAFLHPLYLSIHLPFYTIIFLHFIQKEIEGVLNQSLEVHAHP